MKVVNSITELRQIRRPIQGRVGIVPTMGALHKGHLALLEHARQQCDTVIATIFVNPTQFAPTEDLSAYPRDLPRDLQMLETVGVDCVFTPTAEIMYPSGFQTFVEVENVTQGLEGAQRPGHFRGVATVVNKLFNLTRPDLAFFGQKDAQQVAVIRRMVYDLNMPVEIVVVPTVREADGLALSSRNAYLNSEQRVVAPILYQSLTAADELYRFGERSPEKLLKVVEQRLAREPLVTTQYTSIVDAQTLQPLAQGSAAADRPLLVSLAAQIGRTRLIDNVVLPLTLNTSEQLTRVLGNPDFQV